MNLQDLREKNKQRIKKQSFESFNLWAKTETLLELKKLRIKNLLNLQDLREKNKQGIKKSFESFNLWQK